MPNASAAAIPVTSAWLDLTVSNAALANVDVDLQFNGRVENAIAEYRTGGADPGAGAAGRTLESGKSVSVNSDHIWVRALLGGRIDPIIV